MDRKEAAFSAAVVSHIPQLFVEEGLKNPDLLAERGRFHNGSLVFADVSGFTAMSEKLSELGKEGAEELTRVLNDHFTRMLGIASEYGGSLLKFGGDAMLLLFSDANHAARAVRCALLMQQEMKRTQNVKTSMGVFQLRMSVGINSGEFLLASVGSPDERLYVFFSGNEVNRTALIESAANATEIYIGPGTLQELGGKVEGSEGREGYFDLKRLKTRVQAAPIEDFSKREIEKPVLDRLASYLPPQFLGRLRAAGELSAVSGEHRRVTVMFINVLGISELIEKHRADGEMEIITVLHRYFDMVHKTVRKYGGLTIGSDLNTRGEKLLIIFGAPVAHEDDDTRAVLCALEIQRLLEESGLPLEQKTGINSGFVFSGELGSPSRMEYTVMGDHVNLAARLLGVAGPGDIVIGQSTYIRTKDEFAMQALEPVMVKGKSQPVAAYRVEHFLREGTQQAKTRGKLIGRDKELDTIKGLADRAAGGQGQSLAIRGPAGIGKSRLVEELRDYWAGKSPGIHSGNCQSYTQSSPFHPWIEALESFFSISKDDSPSLRADKIRNSISELCPEFLDWASIPGSLLNANIPETDVVVALDAKLRHQRLLDIILELVQAKASGDKPLLLIFQDLQWADSSSVELLDYVMRNIAAFPVMVCLAFRLEESLVFRAEDLSNFQAIDLGEFSPEDSLALARLMIDDKEVPDELKTLILEKSQGNPLFIEETLHALRDAGHLKINPVTAEYELSGDLRELGVPDTVQGLIMSRIDQLDENLRGVLVAAAVAGQSFEFPMVKEIYPVELADNVLQERFYNLEKLDLITSRDENRIEFYFKNTLTQEVAYESLLYSQRRQLHRKAGAYIEERHKRQLEEHFEALSYHYTRTHLYDRALRYSIKAGDKAKNLFTNREAIDFYRSALQALPKIDEDLHLVAGLVLERLGDIFELRGEYDEAYDSYTESLERYKNSIGVKGRRAKVNELLPGLDLPEDAELQAAILSQKAGIVQERKGEYAAAIEWLENALNLVKSDGGEAAEIDYSMAGVLYRMGRHSEAMEWCEKGLKTADAVSGKAELAHGYYLLGTLYTELGNSGKAIEYREQSLRIYEEAADLMGQARVNNNLGVDYYYFGDWEKAKEHYRKSLEIRQKMGDIWGVTTVSNNLGEIYSDQGYYEDAISTFQTCLKTYQRIGNNLGIGLSFNNLGRAYSRKGELDLAMNLLTTALSIFERLSAKGFLMENYIRLAEAHLAQGEYAEALEHCEKALESARESGIQLVEGAALRVKGQTLAGLGKTGEAEEALLRSVEILDSINSPYEVACTLWELSLILVSAAENDERLKREGRERLARARKIFSDLGVMKDPKQDALLMSGY